MPSVSNGGLVPLNLRLRAEADEWDEDEAVRKLILEAAEAIEYMAAELVTLRWTMDRVKAVSGA